MRDGRLVDLYAGSTRFVRAVSTSAAPCSLSASATAGETRRSRDIFHTLPRNVHGDPFVDECGGRLREPQAGPDDRIPDPHDAPPNGKGGHDPARR